MSPSLVLRWVRVTVNRPTNTTSGPSGRRTQTFCLSPKRTRNAFAHEQQHKPHAPPPPNTHILLGRILVSPVADTQSLGQSLTWELCVDDCHECCIEWAECGAGQLRLHERLAEQAAAPQQVLTKQLRKNLLDVGSIHLGGGVQERAGGGGGDGGKVVGSGVGGRRTPGG